jgi:PAS domain-containing protein
MAQRFLELLDDVHRLHGLFLQEITTLRARVAELESHRSEAAAGCDEDVSVREIPGCAVYLVSEEGVIQSWSGGAGELYGYSVEEILGRTKGTLSMDPSIGLGAIQGNARGSWRLRKDGKPFEVYSHQVSLIDQAGHSCGRLLLEIPVRQVHSGPAIAMGDGS